MKKLGLIGFPLGHSFSKKYYLEKFDKEHITGVNYDLYSIADIQEFEKIFKDQDFYGVNVTIPHKINVLPYIQELSPEAEAIQAVNCIQIKHKASGPFLKGFNTDVFGFMESLKPLLEEHHKKALILGNGGAAKAVEYALNALHISYRFVSRTKTDTNLTYSELNAQLLNEYHIIINCSPVGTFPNIEDAPDIPYNHIGDKHLLYDLVYNPAETAFLKKGKNNGAKIKNGLQMLELQAEKNWEIWNEMS
ncbi:shikimate 5-dehydrogenase [Sphingobacterium faecium NBRC 15299]|uniref:shikimate dehydrogenase family protein n=1 Tax=Sphingobacterium faecium TaxID=34087 RepID=UPI000D371497|nr:shikimate dehydrogenase [Sphingobacterium faecium]PTX12322.1 shikimate dehydrogenase [Sphingobacterium faecium]GEM62030.1 shikimate 5-dehydrogenase [Sphingobacterium faecium NBRC 15299]